MSGTTLALKMENRICNAFKRFPEMTAIFSASDEMAAGAMQRHIKKRLIYLRVSIICYDNILVNHKMSNPPDQTIEQVPCMIWDTTPANVNHQIDEKSNDK